MKSGIHQHGFPSQTHPIFNGYTVKTYDFQGRITHYIIPDFQSAMLTNGYGRAAAYTHLSSEYALPTSILKHDTCIGVYSCSLITQQNHARFYRPLNSDSSFQCSKMRFVEKDR